MVEPCAKLPATKPVAREVNRTTRATPTRRCYTPRSRESMSADPDPLLFDGKDAVLSWVLLPASLGLRMANERA